MHKLIATLVLMAASIPAAPSIAAEWPSAGFSHTVAAVAGEPVVPVRGGMGMGGGGGMGMGGGGGMGMGGSASMGNGTPASGLPSGGSSTGSAQSADHAGCMAAQPSDTSWLVRWAHCAVGGKGSVPPTSSASMDTGKKPLKRRVASRNATEHRH